MITGNTRLFGIVADPIDQVQTPQMLNRIFEQQGRDAVLVPFHVPEKGLSDVFAAFRQIRNLGGYIVTVPHKVAARELCDEIGDAARAIGAVNTIRRDPDGRLIGDMFDGTGFVAGLKVCGNDPAGRRVLLVGAGGAAAAIAHALAKAGVETLVITNRTRSRAEKIAERVADSVPGVRVVAGRDDPYGYDMVVNATSLGMRPDDPLPLDVALLSPDTLVAEIIMKPEMTPLLQQAQARGCPIHLGRHMLEEQAALMVGFMTAGQD